MRVGGKVHAACRAREFAFYGLDTVGGITSGFDDEGQLAHLLAYGGGKFMVGVGIYRYLLHGGKEPIGIGGNEAAVGGSYRGSRTAYCDAIG